MWEWPWIRRLLAGLPISRYHGLDLRTRPAAHRRLRRVSRGSQRFLPAPLRPTRHFWRRRIDPHDFSIYVYNTWALDYDMVSELSSLLAKFRHVGLVAIDESTQDSTDIYDRVKFAVRIGFHATKYETTKTVVVAPLGVPKHFVHPDHSPRINDRKFSWSFLGEPKNASRRNMITHLNEVAGTSFVHAISGWNAEDSLRGEAYSNILANSIFVPSPSANVHCECYRTYEALECGAIPVVDTEYYRDAFGAPFPIARPTWDGAAHMLNRWLDDRESLARLQSDCQGWWNSARIDFRSRIATLAGFTPVHSATRTDTSRDL
jgi:hypothetical protein